MMNFFIEKNQLCHVLQLMVGITSKNTNEPIINNVLLKTVKQEEKYFLELKATDYDISIQCILGADIRDEGCICVSAYRLFQLAKEINSDILHLSITDQNWVYVEGGSTDIKLPGLEPGLFPPIKFKPLQNQFLFFAKELRDVIDRTYFAIGENQAKKNLTGLNLRFIDNSKIQWFGADGFRISQVVSEFDENNEISGNIIIPKKGLLEIRKILDHVKDQVLISFDDGFYQVEGKNICFKTKLIEAEYPDLRPIILNNFQNKAEVSLAEITNAVRILSLFSQNNATSMKLTFEKDELYVESEKREFGEANQKIPLKYQGEKIAIAFNIHYFLEALNSFDPSVVENVIFHTNNAHFPCLMECQEWGLYKTLIMPLKIKW